MPEDMDVDQLFSASAAERNRPARQTALKIDLERAMRRSLRRRTGGDRAVLP